MIALKPPTFSSKLNEPCINIRIYKICHEDASQQSYGLDCRSPKNTIAYYARRARSQKAFTPFLWASINWKKCTSGHTSNINSAAFIEISKYVVGTTEKSSDFPAEKIPKRHLDRQNEFLSHKYNQLYLFYEACLYQNSILLCRWNLVSIAFLL